jgi:hypothetical protein
MPDAEIAATSRLDAVRAEAEVAARASEVRGSVNLAGFLRDSLSV